MPQPRLEPQHLYQLLCHFLLLLKGAVLRLSGKDLLYSMGLKYWKSLSQLLLWTLHGIQETIDLLVNNMKDTVADKVVAWGNFRGINVCIPILYRN